MNTADKLACLTTMAQYPAAYAAELRGLPARACTWKPSSTEWSLAEVMAHLADSEEIYLKERLERTMREDQPAVAGFDQDLFAAERRYQEMEPAESLARFARANAQVVALAWTIPEEAWQRVGVHSEAGELTFAEMLLRLATHHHSHLNQMRRIKAQYLRAGFSLA